MLHQYIHGIYYVYTRHILVYATDIASTSCCFQGFCGTHCQPAPPICICIIWRGSTSMDDAYDILCICRVYTIHILTKIYWYINYDILICHVYVVYIIYISWQFFFVRDMTQPQVSTLCSWSSNISACLDRQPIWRGSILLLSTCGLYNRSDEDIPLDLVFFSPFEELRLRSSWGQLESFLDGNATSIIPHTYSSRQRDAFECCCADGAGPTSRRGSHVYEINTWLRLAVELWTVPASRARPLCGQDWEDQKEVPVWCCQTSVGNKAGLDCQVTGIYMVYTWYIHDIYHVYPGWEWNITLVYIRVVVMCYHAVCMYFQFFQFP
jgi:hypothetical protein